MDKDRKTVIADAAISLLATAGAKGLTHRAVDAQAGLPPGSTSAYCRTRHELLTLTLLRHVALDMEDLAADTRKMAADPWSPADLADLLSRRVADWLSPAKRGRLVARFELFMMASHDEALAAIVAQQRQRFLAATEAALRRSGVARPGQVAPMLMVAVDAMLLDQVSATGPVLAAGQRKAMFGMILGQAGG